MPSVASRGIFNMSAFGSAEIHGASNTPAPRLRGIKAVPMV